MNAGLLQQLADRSLLDSLTQLDFSPGKPQRPASGGLARRMSRIRLSRITTPIGSDRPCHLLAAGRQFWSVWHDGQHAGANLPLLANGRSRCLWLCHRGNRIGGISKVDWQYMIVAEAIEAERPVLQPVLAPFDGFHETQHAVTPKRTYCATYSEP